MLIQAIAYFPEKNTTSRRIVPDQWIFGGYDASTKEGFLLPLPRRTAATLMPLIIQWIRPRTKTWSDMYGGRTMASLLKVSNMMLLTTSITVDIITGVTTNHVGAILKRVKVKFKSFSPTNCDMIPDYLVEFMWNQRFKDH